MTRLLVSEHLSSLLWLTVLSYCKNSWGELARSGHGPRGPSISLYAGVDSSAEGKLVGCGGWDVGGQAGKEKWSLFSY